jgi:hypothetical protein
VRNKTKYFERILFSCFEKKNANEILFRRCYPTATIPFSSAAMGHHLVFDNHSVWYLVPYPPVHVFYILAKRHRDHGDTSQDANRLRAFLDP